MWTIGVDEAGRGCVLGPMVHAAFGCRDDRLDELLRMGVKDSKKFTGTSGRKRRDALCARLTKEFPCQHVHSVTAAYISHSGKGSLNRIEIASFQQCIGQVLGLIETEHTSAQEKEKWSVKVTIDSCDRNTERMTEIFRQWYADDQGTLKYPFLDVTFEARCHADATCPAVGAASILAKTVREEWVKRDPSRGSGYPNDPTTKRWLRAQTSFHGGNVSDIPDMRTWWETAQKRTWNDTVTDPEE